MKYGKLLTFHTGEEIELDLYKEGKFMSFESGEWWDNAGDIHFRIYGKKGNDFSSIFLWVIPLLLLGGLYYLYKKTT